MTPSTPPSRPTHRAIALYAAILRQHEEIRAEAHTEPNPVRRAHLTRATDQLGALLHRLGLDPDPSDSTLDEALAILDATDNILDATDNH